MKKLLGLVAAGAVFIGIGMAIGIGAFSTDHQDTTTGAFTTDSENTHLQVRTFRTSDGTEDPTNWLSGPSIVTYASNPTAATRYGAVKVKNTTTSLNLSYSMATINVVDTDGKHLAQRLYTRIVRPVTSDQGMPVTNTCGSSSFWDTPSRYTILSTDNPLSAQPGFGDATPGVQSGDLTLTPNQEDVICFKVTYDPDYFHLDPVFAASTGATFRFSADDTP